MPLFLPRRVVFAAAAFHACCWATVRACYAAASLRMLLRTAICAALGIPVGTVRSRMTVPRFVWVKTLFPALPRTLFAKMPKLSVAIVLFLARRKVPAGTKELSVVEGHSDHEKPCG